MKIYIEVLKMFFNKFLMRKSTGEVIKNFSTNMGIAYIKLAQILATQNYEKLFTEDDREILSSICDDCNPISFHEIKRILEREYGQNLESIFSFIDPNPIGSASISQVHRAILKNGEEVAIKVKREDVTATLVEDIAMIKSLFHKFGWLVNFKNSIGGEHAIDLYSKWILEEADFIHEQENIKTYTRFAESVNGKIEGIKKIRLPKLYESLCTPNVIVMEFIKNKTLNKLEDIPENRDRIAKAINSYFQLSFYALLNSLPIAFHGDPHQGNIYLDDEGNIGFLDMGLLFALSKKDQDLTRQFFLTAYSKNYEKLYELLEPYTHFSKRKSRKFKEALRTYADSLKYKNITSYFIDLVEICKKYQFLPPDFLFGCSKAFLCLDGMNGIINNAVPAQQLLEKQVIEYLIKRSLQDGKNIAIRCVHLAPIVFRFDGRFDLVRSFSNNFSTIEQELGPDLITTLKNFKEVLDIIKNNYETVENHDDGFHI